MRVWYDPSLPGEKGLRRLVAEVATFDPSPGEIVRNSVLRSNLESALDVQFDLTWSRPSSLPDVPPRLARLASVKITWLTTKDRPRVDSDSISRGGGTEEEDAPEIFGRLKWFVGAVGASTAVGRWKASGIDWNDAPLVPGRLLGEEEAEVYAALGEVSPILWEPVRFAKWVLERPDTVVVGGRVG